MIVHRYGTAVHAVAAAAGGAANLTAGYVLDDQIKNVHVVYAKQHGIHAPRFVSRCICAAGVNRDGIGVLEAAGLLCGEGDHAAGGGLALAHSLAGLLDGILHHGVRIRRLHCVPDCGQGLIVCGVAVKRIERDLERRLLDVQISRFLKIRRQSHHAAGGAALIAGADDNGVDTGIGELIAGNGNMGTGVINCAEEAFRPNRIACGRIVHGVDLIQLCGEGGFLLNHRIARCNIGGEQYVRVGFRQRCALFGERRNRQERRLSFQNRESEGKVVLFAFRTVANRKGNGNVSVAAGQHDLSGAGFLVLHDLCDLLVAARPGKVFRLGEGKAVAVADTIVQDQGVRVFRANAVLCAFEKNLVHHELHVVLPGVIRPLHHNVFGALLVEAERGALVALHDVVFAVIRSCGRLLGVKPNNALDVVTVGLIQHRRRVVACRGKKGEAAGISFLGLPCAEVIRGRAGQIVDVEAQCIPAEE